MTRYRRDLFTRLSFNPSPLSPPILYGGDGSIRERRITFKEFLHIDAAVFLVSQLELHDSLQAGALRESRVGRLREIHKALKKIVRILGDASPDGDFQTGEPAFQPIHFF